MRIALCFLSIILFVSSCSEDIQINEVTGYICQDCSKAPLANAEIALRSVIGNAFDEVRIIGAATSNSTGRFQFTYELKEGQKGKVDLLLVSSSGSQELLSNLDANIDINTSLYFQNKSRIYINLSGSKVFSSADTLFLGVSGSSITSSVIQPLSGRIDTMQIEVPNQLAGTTSRTFYYGVGLQQFQESMNALGTATPVRHINLNLTGCNQDELVDLVID